MAEPLIKVRGLSKTYVRRPSLVARLLGVKTSIVPALSDIDLDIGAGETLGVVGESGSGKSTLGRILAGLVQADAGSVIYREPKSGTGEDEAPRVQRRRVQIVFQNPYASLNPRHSIGKTIDVALRLRGLSGAAERRERAVRLLEAVGLHASYLNRYPYALSGGQRQRVAIARALAMEPEFLILDEPTSALDVSIQAQILRLLGELKVRFHLTYLLISHNLSVVAVTADRMVVMQQGRVVEVGDTERVIAAPRHEYTAKLLEAVPTIAGSSGFGDRHVADLSPTSLPKACEVGADSPSPNG
jgi:ABC-type glutathione transport system ATPase component